ncbi:MAG: metal-dependent transcriptional regulator [candidate division NC10 bacterium]|nr:metal-dependent transcriptional regulator [candidate division NC10 bacterium]
MVITQAIEDYLKTIYLLGQGGEVATSAIALKLKVSPPSVTGMVKKLAEMKLLRYTRYQGVELTPAGEKIALEVVRHHRLLELYLQEALGYPWDKVHEEAEKLEHVISEEFEDRIAEALGWPETDPHGHPIPTKDGVLPAVAVRELLAVETGQSATVRQVSDGDPGMLRYLASLGFFPGATVQVLEKAPFEGPLRVRVGEAEHAVGRELARHVLVSAATPAEV